jgi:hypothetical protein
VTLFQINSTAKSARAASLTFYDFILWFCFDNLFPREPALFVIQRQRSLSGPEFMCGGVVACMHAYNFFASSDCDLSVGRF